MTKSDQLVENLEYLRTFNYAIGIYCYMDGCVEVSVQSDAGNFLVDLKAEGPDLSSAIQNLTNQVKEAKNGQAQKYDPNQTPDNQLTGGLDW